MYILSWIAIGFVAGWLTGKLVVGNGYGPIVDIVMGIAGAIGGGFIMRLAGSPAHGGLGYTSLAALMGAAILTATSAHATAESVGPKLANSL
jgi:uncharacterized membrane protein YeaQ/YmgE (transglycosylase-associated protein family)